MSNRRWPGGHAEPALTLSAAKGKWPSLLAIVIVFLAISTAQAASPFWPLGDHRGLAHRGLGDHGGSPPAAGRVLVKFRVTATAAEVAALIDGHGWQALRHIPGVDLTVVGVPDGQEAAVVAQLRAEPLVEYAEPDRVVVEAPAGPAYFTAEMQSPIETRERGEGETWGKSPGHLVTLSPCHLVSTSPVSAAGGVAVTNLRMATAPGGAAPYENKFSAGRSEVYAVFDYDLDTPGTWLQVGVSYQDPMLGALSTFEAAQAYTGTGSTSVVVPASQAFPNQSSFRPGWYDTTVATTTDDGQSWVTLASVRWQAVTIPNDEHFDRWQWNLNNWGQPLPGWDVMPGVDINAPEAWDVTTGRRDLVIAFVGSGVELSHPDLRDRIWRNPGEIPGNGRDDDGNGYVDDVRGWDFAYGDNDPSDDYGNGTFAAGLAAATSNNNRGIAGVTWGGQIMPVKVLYLYGDPPQAGGRISDVIAGVHYAADNGARIIHLSFQDMTTDFGVIESLRQAIDYAHQRGALVVAGAGDRALQGNPVVYPAAFENVLSVAATDGQDRRVASSSTGFWVDVAAPAQPVVSTYNGAYYRTPPSLTLYSAAEVAGLAALVWSVDPSLTADQVKTIIEQSADDLGSPGRDDAYGWGRINAERAVRTTAHRLTLSRSSLIFLQQDDQAPLCYAVTNPNTSAITWRAETPAVNWLTITGPTGQTPSSIQVCANPGQVPGHGVYTTEITATSTLTTHVNSPITLPVRLVKTDRVWKLHLPVVLRKAPAW